MKVVLGLLLSVLGGLGLFGCGSDDRGTGGGDDGGIRIMDSGAGRRDTGGGGGRDSGGGGGMDTGGGGGMCADPIAPLPAEALPRCSAMTRSCVMACTTVACINMCLMSDTTPPVMAGMTTIDCGF